MVEQIYRHENKQTQNRLFTTRHLVRALEVIGLIALATTIGMNSQLRNGMNQVIDASKRLFNMGLEANKHCLTKLAAHTKDIAGGLHKIVDNKILASIFATALFHKIAQKLEQKEQKEKIGWQILENLYRDNERPIEIIEVDDGE